MIIGAIASTCHHLQDMFIIFGLLGFTTIQLSFFWFFLLYSNLVAPSTYVMYILHSTWFYALVIFISIFIPCCSGNMEDTTALV